MTEQNKKDYIEKCNQAKIPLLKHIELKCKFCSKHDCVRAEKASTKPK